MPGYSHSVVIPHSVSLFLSFCMCFSLRVPWDLSMGGITGPSQFSPNESRVGRTWLLFAGCLFLFWHAFCLGEAACVAPLDLFSDALLPRSVLSLLR